MAVAVRCLVPTLVGGLLWAGQAGAQATVATGTISGRVVDSTTSQPLANVTVSIVGTQRGTLTRNDGGFVLTAVPLGQATVRVARIGYGSKSQTVTVSGGAPVSIQFTLAAQAASLTQVVVVGYGTQRREAITGSVATVQADEANVGVVANANQLLTARVAGVNVTSNNGEPGGGAQVRIRGGTSLSASNEPLYVIDGVPLQNENPVAGAAGVGGINAALGRSPLNSINPDDIASITVLKDASATAIYGSRGGNGVILIETKKGASSGTTTLDYDGWIAGASPANSLDFLNGSQYSSFVRGQVSRGGLPQTALGNLGTANTDWFDEVTRQSFSQNHNLAFSGGSTNTQYRASLNYFDQNGVVINNGLERYQGRLNAQSQALAGKLQLGLNLTAARINNRFLPFENGGGFEGGVFTNTAVFNPTQPVKVANPVPGRSPFYEIGAGAQSVRNPVALAEQVSDRAPENRILGNITASYALLPSLTFRQVVGVDLNTSRREAFFPRINPVGAQFNGLARQEQRDLSNVNYQALATFAPTLGERHEVEVLGGYEFTQVDNSGFRAEMRNIVSDQFRWDNLEGGQQRGSPLPVSYRQQSRLVSFLTRANYSYRNRYFLSAALRADGSSRLAKGNQWATFPTVSASWRVSEEGFAQGLPFSNLSVRAGWGMTGSQAVRPYGTQLLLNAAAAGNYPFGSSIFTGLLASQVANPDLKWETTTSAELGLDWGVKSNRINGGIALYERTTRDLLLEIAVPQPAVVSTRFENIGSIRNRGLEANVDAELWRSGTRTLNAGLVLAVERNQVVEIGRQFIQTAGVQGQGQSGRFSQRILPGQPLGTFWGPQYVRMQNGQQLFACARQGNGCTNGVTTDPTGDDERIIGNANPDFSIGLPARISWGKFDANWLWRAEVGRDVFNNTALVYASKANAKQGRNFLASALDDGSSIDEPAKYSSRWIEDGSFLRLQNAQVGYRFTLPARFGGRSTRVYVAGDNLLLFSPYSGYDPEAFVDLGLGSRGIDYLIYPRARSFQVGTQIQF